MHHNYIVVIEIPKGSDRRTHMAYDKSGFVDLGSIKDSIPVNNGIMPVHYGYIEGTFNKEDSDEVDVMVFSKKAYGMGDKVTVAVTGIFKRADGDHKIIAFDDTFEHFVFEKFPTDEQKVILDFMGYKAKIISIENREVAMEYIKSCLRK